MQIIIICNTIYIILLANDYFNYIVDTLSEMVIELCHLWEHLVVRYKSGTTKKEAEAVILILKFI